MPVTIAEIEDAIIARLQENGIDPRMEVGEEPAGNPVSRIKVFTDFGRLEKISQDTYKQVLTVSLSLVFRNIAGRRRRLVLYPILEGIIGILLLQDLGLSISPLIPRSFRNVTTEEGRQAGELAYLIEVDTSYTVTKMTGEEAVDLLSAGLNYFLKPGDDAADAFDNVILGQGQ